MGSVQEIQLHIRGEESQEQNPSSNRRRNYRWWVLVSLYTIGLLVSQSGATLLGRFYYDNGAKSKWLATLVQCAGFPLVFPFIFFFSSSSTSTSNPSGDMEITFPSIPTLALLYIGIGIVITVDNLMYSYALSYLPVSTYSLLCATQLAFNALFSYFLNSLRFTPFVLNSVVLLTISASILGLHAESTGPLHVSKVNHIIGFLCTIGASALYSLGLALVQLCFEKVLKGESMRVIMEMQVFPAMLSSGICVAGLFVSKEWRNLKGEMEGFKTGKVSYIMTVFWTTVLWQLYSVCCLGLIYEASSLLSNVVSTVGLPIIPILAVVLFHDKMDEMKAVAMVLAVWGFVSYFYQHYLDSKSDSTRENDTSRSSH